MTDQELQQLAREYAEQNPPTDLKDEVLKENLIGLNAEIFEKFLEWLTKTHCIVSREKVNQLYKVALSNKKSQDILLQDSGIVQTSILEVAFGKSTFEERSEK